MSKKPQYDWTVMVYLSGDNNLSSEMLWALTEIERAMKQRKDGERLALTVQYDPLSPACGTLRYAMPYSETFKTLPKLKRPAFKVPFAHALRRIIKGEDAASPSALGEFIDWSVKAFPSKYRMLILSGHGSGAEGDFLTDDNPGQGTGARPRPQAVSAKPADDEPRLPPSGTLTIPALGQVLAPSPATRRMALAKGRDLSHPRPRIDVLGMDSCLMSTLEVADEVSRSVTFLVGSEGFIPNTGWPYFELLTKLRQTIADKKDFGPAVISAVIVDECADYYGEYLPSGVSLDIASCELAHIRNVRRKVATLATHLTKHIAVHDVRNSIILAHWRAQAFKLEQYADLWDFCSELATEVSRHGRPGKEIATACHDVLDAINRVLGIPSSKTPESPVGRGRQRSLGLDFQYARGLSVYFPWCAPTMAGFDYFAQYRRLRFPKRSGWGRFLDAYLGATMRPPRNESGKPLDKLRLLDVTGRGLMAKTKNVHQYNKNVHQYNKFIAEMFGGRPPWCTRNQPQMADVSPQPPAASSQRAATPARAARRPSASSRGRVGASMRLTNGSGRPWPSPTRPRVGGKRPTRSRKPARPPMSRIRRRRL
jgi:hypothetical protein